MPPPPWKKEWGREEGGRCRRVRVETAGGEVSSGRARRGRMRGWWRNAAVHEEEGAREEEARMAGGWRHLCWIHTHIKINKLTFLAWKR